MDFAMIGIIIQIIQVVFFLLGAWGLYMINSKLGEDHAWLSFIPLLNIYSYVKASGKSLLWILWLIIGFIAFVIPGLVIYVIILHSISKRTGRGGWTTVGLFFIPFIMFPIVGNKLSEKGTTVQKEENKETSTEL